jgi:hypothetical protein
MDIQINAAFAQETTSNLFSKAIEKFQAGLLEDAKIIFYNILAVEPDNHAVLKNLGLLSEAGEALYLFRRALNLKPDDEETRRHIFAILVNVKNKKFGYSENCIRDYPWISNNGKSCDTEILNLVVSLPFNGIFASDNLITWGRNLSFLGDKALMEAISRSGDDRKMAEGLVWRSSVVVWAARNGLRREGDFVECGTYKGTTAKILLEATGIRQTDKKIWLYDVFNWSEGDKHTPLAGLNADLFSKVANLFEDAPNVNLIRGYVPESFNQGMPDKISFLHIDMNNAEGELEALKMLWERVVPGGVIILDDYGWECLSDQKKEEDKFFAKYGYEVLELPTGQGMVMK